MLLSTRHFPDPTGHPQAWLLDIACVRLLASPRLKLGISPRGVNAPVKATTLGTPVLGPAEVYTDDKGAGAKDVSAVASQQTVEGQADDFAREKRSMVYSGGSWEANKMCPRNCSMAGTTLILLTFHFVQVMILAWLFGFCFGLGTWGQLAPWFL